jgi:hypothetical protein
MGFKVLHALKEHATESRLERREKNYKDTKADNFRYYQLCQKAFQTLYLYKTHHKLKMQKDLMLNKRAECHFYNKVSLKIFDGFRTQAQQLAEKNRRSKKYAILIAWKFWAKEKALLKKYLDECNYMSHEGAGGSQSARGS